MTGRRPSQSTSTNINKRPRIRGRLFSLLAALFVAAALAIGLKIRSVQYANWVKNASLDELLQAARQRPKDRPLFRQLGLRQREAGRFAEAADSFQRAVELSPDDEEAWGDWADAVGQARGAPAQMLVLAAWRKTLPQSGRVCARMAEVHYLAENFGTAEKLAREATALTPQLADGWRLLGQLALIRQDLPGATTAFEEARKRNPGDWRIFLGLTKTALAKPDSLSAVEAARQMLALAPNEPVAQLYSARALLSGSPSPEQVTEAQRYLIEALRSSEGLVGESRFDALFYLGDSYAAQSRWQEALPYFEAAGKLAPGSVKLQFRLIKAYTQLGQQEKAKTARLQYRKASVYENTTKTLRMKIASFPKDVQPKLDLARLYTRNGNFVEARKIYQTMIAEGLAVETAQQELTALTKK